VELKITLTSNYLKPIFVKDLLDNDYQLLRELINVKDTYIKLLHKDDEFYYY
jgi:hypothetical protein